MMEIVVWEKPNCVQCNQTKRVFDRMGIQYKTRRLDRSPKAIERFLELGLTAAPIVETDDRSGKATRIVPVRQGGRLEQMGPIAP